MITSKIDSVSDAERRSLLLYFYYNIPIFPCVVMLNSAIVNVLLTEIEFLIFSIHLFW